MRAVLVLDASPDVHHSVNVYYLRLALLNAETDVHYMKKQMPCNHFMSLHYCYVQRSCCGCTAVWLGPGVMACVDTQLVCWNALEIFFHASVTLSLY